MRIGWLWVMGILGAATPAAAGDTAVAVLSGGLSSEPAWRTSDERLVEGFGQGLEAVAGIRLLGPQELDGHFREPSDPQALERAVEARSRLERGWELAARLKPAAAIEELTAALRILRAVFPALPDLADLARAHMLLGATYQALGRDPEADREYRNSLLLDPQRRLDETRFNPAVLERFDRVRESLQTSLKGSVSFVSRPAEALVFMDGRMVGHTPITVPEILPGQHYFHLEADGYRTWSGVLEVPPGGLERREIFLVEGRTIEWRRARERLIASGDEPRARDGHELAAVLGVDALVLLTLQRSPGGAALRLACYQRESEALTVLGIFPVAEATVGELAARTGRWLRGERELFAAAPSPLPGPIPPAPPAVGGATWWRSWWFWTAVGVVAAGAAAGATAAALSRDSGVRLQVVR